MRPSVAIDLAYAARAKSKTTSQQSIPTVPCARLAMHSRAMRAARRVRDACAYLELLFRARHERLGVPFVIAHDCAMDARTNERRLMASQSSARDDTCRQIQS